MSIVFTSRLPVASGGPDMQDNDPSKITFHIFRSHASNNQPNPQNISIPSQNMQFFSLIKNNNLQVII